jgi:predicted TIM-barrel fold metal-dependent hydrolase
MKIDCHCHVFSNNCIAVKGFLQSRFGIFVGDRVLDMLEIAGKEWVPDSVEDLFRHFQIDFAALLDSLTDPAEKDGLRYILRHPTEFAAFFFTGFKDIPGIVETMKQQTPGIHIRVPLTIDTDAAFEGSSPVLNFEQQEVLMMEETLKGGGSIMPFFAYDPRSRPVEAVRTAIEEEGFVGIKLYPPFGFKPLGNTDGSLDEKLRELYRYCSEGRDDPIPITTHCSWSDGAFSNREVAGVSHHKEYYRDMADPAHWVEVLKEYRNLKVNLAHFGGPGEWEARAAVGSAATKGKNWVDTIVGLIRDHEHVYTDLSFHGNFAGGGASGYGDALIEKISGLEHKVLFGSDWYMSRLQCEPDRYWQGFGSLLGEELMARFAEENPRRFLRSEAMLTHLPRFFGSRGAFYDERNIEAFR